MNSQWRRGYDVVLEYAFHLQDGIFANSVEPDVLMNLASTLYSKIILTCFLIFSLSIVLKIAWQVYQNSLFNVFVLFMGLDRAQNTIGHY